VADGLENGRQIVRAVDDHAAEAPLHRPLGFARRRSAARESSPHSRKFLIATASLLALALAAISVSLAILLSGRGHASTSTWSDWSPPDSGTAGEREIANEVAPLYRGTPASQLALVTVHNVSDTGTSTALALRDPSRGSLSAVSGTTAIYTLCGLGPGCTIASGTPSAARLLLLRREALELSLYTFKYIGGIDNVVSILPPGRTQAPARLTRKPPSPGRTATTSTVDLAVVFQRSGLQHYLSEPVRRTLPEQIPPTVAQMPYASEAELVSVITGEALFTQQLIQAQDGSNVLVLNPAPAQ
jgi:hypothetical protein